LPLEANARLVINYFQYARTIVCLQVNVKGRSRRLGLKARWQRLADAQGAVTANMICAGRMLLHLQVYLEPPLLAQVDGLVRLDGVGKGYALAQHPERSMDLLCTSSISCGMYLRWLQFPACRFRFLFMASPMEKRLTVPGYTPTMENVPALASACKISFCPDRFEFSCFTEKVSLAIVGKCGR
jgi:hypothetical protein